MTATTHSGQLARWIWVIEPFLVPRPTWDIITAALPPRFALQGIRPESATCLLLDWEPRRAVALYPKQRRFRPGSCAAGTPWRSDEVLHAAAQSRLARLLRTAKWFNAGGACTCR